MKFTVTERVHFPASQVFLTYRDKMPELAKDMPNVGTIIVEKRETLPDGRIYLLNRWNASGAIPAPLRAILSEDMLTWLDHAKWDDKQSWVDYELEFKVFPEGAVRSGGRNRFQDNGDGTTSCVIDGYLELDLAKVPKVPRLLRPLGPKVEDFLIGRIKPNLVEVCRAVERYLDRQKSA